MLALACLLGGCQAAPKAEDDMQSMPNMEVETNGEYHKITAEEAWEMMAAQMVTVVDVRTAEEYSQGHIANAILVPNETIEAEAAAALTDLDATILVYCRSGRRSARRTAWWSCDAGPITWVSRSTCSPGTSRPRGMTRRG